MYYVNYTDGRYHSLNISDIFSVYSVRNFKESESGIKFNNLATKPCDTGYSTSKMDHIMQNSLCIDNSNEEVAVTGKVSFGEGTEI